MSKERTGYLFERKGVLYIRVQFKDAASGKLRDKLRKVQNPQNWQAERDQFIKELERPQTTPSHSGIKFSELADYFKAQYLIPAVYSKMPNGTIIKITGYKGLSTIEGYFKHIRAYFDPYLLSAITYEDLRQFKLYLLKTPIWLGTPRSLADTHRHLSMLRRMLRIAEQKEWIAVSPFKKGDPLINASLEVQRQTITTREQEAKMIAACTGRCAHLRPILIFLLDTGCRANEAFTLDWRDVNLQERAVTIQALNTKTLKEKRLKLTTRLHAELLTIWTKKRRPKSGSVFGIKVNVRRSFATACKAAGIEPGKLRRHDLRHTAATRMIKQNVPLPIVARILGHSSLSHITYRYINADDESLSQAAAALEAYQDKKEDC